MTLEATLKNLFYTLIVVLSVTSTLTLKAETAKTIPPGRVSQAFSMVLGPDGNIWFTEQVGLKIGKITPTGVVTEYPIPGARGLTGIAVGADGNIWFTDELSSFIGHINTSGGNLKLILLGTTSHPEGLAAGPDGNLWFVDDVQGISSATGAFKIGRVSTSGHVTEFSSGINAGYFIPDNYANAQIVTGPDGARITTSGVVSTVPLTTLNSVPNGLTFGADGKIYVAEYGSGALGRLSAIGGTGNTINATHGSPFSGPVASFVDGTPTSTQGDFSATIDWGDGTHNSGTVSGANGGPFTVNGTHTYSRAGGYTLKVTLQDNVDNSTYQASPGVAQVR